MEFKLNGLEFQRLMSKHNYSEAFKFAKKYDNKMDFSDVSCIERWAKNQESKELSFDNSEALFIIIEKGDGLQPKFLNAYIYTCVRVIDVIAQRPSAFLRFLKYYHLKPLLENPTPMGHSIFCTYLFSKQGSTNIEMRNFINHYVPTNLVNQVTPFGHTLLMLTLMTNHMTWFDQLIQREDICIESECIVDSRFLPLSTEQWIKRDSRTSKIIKCTINTHNRKIYSIFLKTEHLLPELDIIVGEYLFKDDTN